MTGPYQVIVNPRAGGGRTGKLWPQLMEQMEKAGVPYRWELTRGPQDAARLAREAPADATVVVVGGDGTVHECVAGLERPRTLGVIPTGRCNDFARSVGISLNPSEALQQLLTGEVRHIDMPSVNGVSFMSALSLGHGVAMARSTQRFAKRVSAVDLFNIFKALPRIQAPELTVELDGRTSKGKVFMLTVGNGRFFGGGLDLCPEAHCDDGLLDVCIAGDLGRFEAVMALTRFFGGTHVRQRKFYYSKAHSVHIDGPPELTLEADGEIVGRLPASISLEQRVLPLVVPTGRWRPSKITSIWHRRLSQTKEEASP